MVSDLNDEVLSDLSRAIFERARFGEQVGGGQHLHAVIRHLAESEPEDSKFWPSVLGTLMAQALDIPDPSGRGTSQRNRRLASRWGISAADLVSNQVAPVRLDFDLGVLRNAA